MSKAFEPRIGRTLAKAMGRNRHGLQLERGIQAPLRAFELFDEGNKPIHGGVVVVRVLKKGNLLQKGINLEKLQKGINLKAPKGINLAKVNNKDQVTQNHQDAEAPLSARLGWVHEALLGFAFAFARLLEPFLVPNLIVLPNPAISAWLRRWIQGPWG